MKAIICAGGLGTRLCPLTDPLSKHLLPVFDKPMIVHVIETLVAGGVTEIMLSLNAYHPGLYLEMLGDGRQLGCDLTYKYLPRTNGPGKTLLLAENFVRSEHFVLALGDGLFFCPVPFAGKTGPHLFLVPLEGLDEPGKYTQALVKNGHVIELAYKPQTPVSDLAQASCYVFPPDVFDRIRRIDALGNPDIHISDLTDEYVREGGVPFTMLPPRSHIDCGSIEALETAAHMLRELRESGRLPARPAENRQMELRLVG
jgi:glucose-1-phosphate thymidylyltransferase